MSCKRSVDYRRDGSIMVMVNDMAMVTDMEKLANIKSNKVVNTLRKVR